MGKIIPHIIVCVCVWWAEYLAVDFDGVVREPHEVEHHLFCGGDGVEWYVSGGTGGGTGMGRWRDELSRWQGHKCK